MQPGMPSCAADPDHLFRQIFYGNDIMARAGACCRQWIRQLLPPVRNSALDIEDGLKAVYLFSNFRKR
jgi:hypothetical protein